MKRRNFLGTLLGTPVVIGAGIGEVKAKSEETFSHNRGKFGFVRVRSPIKEGDRLFCSSRNGDDSIDAWVAKNGDAVHAISLHDVSWKFGNPVYHENGEVGFEETPLSGLSPATLTCAVKFI